MSAFALFQRRFRGFRVIDLAGFACLATLVLGVYAFKAHAGGQSAKIAEVNVEIAEAQRQIRMLDAELAHLEEPERLEALSSQYLNLAPISAKHETSPDGLMAVARAAGEPPAKGKPAASGAAAAVPAGAPR